MSPSLPVPAQCCGCTWPINSHKHTFSGRDVFVGEGLGARQCGQCPGSYRAAPRRLHRLVMQHYAHWMAWLLPLALASHAGGAPCLLHSAWIPLDSSLPPSRLSFTANGSTGCDCERLVTCNRSHPASALLGAHGDPVLCRPHCVGSPFCC